MFTDSVEHNHKDKRVINGLFFNFIYLFPDLPHSTELQVNLKQSSEICVAAEPPSLPLKG